MKSRLAGAAVLAVAAAVAAGCGSDDAAPPVIPAPGGASGASGVASAPPADLSDPVIAWAERVCGVVEQGGKSLSRFPAVDPADPVKSKQAMVDYLKAISAELGRLGEGITAAGAPPVDDGPAAVDAALKRIATLRASLADAGDKLADAPTTDPAAFQAALAEIGPTLDGLNTADGPTAELTANPELREAFSTAPACLRVEGA